MARGDSKVIAANVNNKTIGSDTLAYLLITNTFASINANSTLVIAGVTGATVGGNYAGKTTIASVTSAQTANVTAIDYADISFAANASNPTDALCLVVMNDTLTGDPVLKITDLTTNGTTAVDLTQGFTFNINAGGSYTYTANV